MAKGIAIPTAIRFIERVWNERKNKKEEVKAAPVK